MILEKEAIGSISKKLGIQFLGYEQDWEIEMADSNRVEEFILFYKKATLSKNEKIVLFTLILASYDDYLSEKIIDEDELWYLIIEIMRFETETVKEVVDYWSLVGERHPENLFKITPLIKDLQF